MNKRKRKRAIELHVLDFLQRMGAEGTKASSSKLALEFGIGKGTVNLYIRCVQKVILDLEQEHVV